MAIGEDDVIEVFGTQTDITDGSTAALSDNTFASGDVTTFTNSDDAPEAAVVLTFEFASGTLNSVPYCVLHYRMLNVDGTDDEHVPDATGKKPLATFHTDPGQGTGSGNRTSYVQRVRLPNLKSSQEYEFYLENQTGVTLTAGWYLKLTPVTVGPHPA